jgi:hypothetical protein
MSIQADHDAVIGLPIDVGVLAGLREPSGFAHLPMPRLELYLYTLRHLQHQAGWPA